MRASALPYLRRLPIAQTMPNAIRLVKLRADSGYLEFVIYLPMHPNGIDWARLYFSNRLNVGNTGCGRLIRATVASLFLSTQQGPYGENFTGGTQAQAPTVTRLHDASVSRTGTWTAAATTGAVTGVRYSTATGDYVEYDITGVDRIALRTYQNSGVGGIFDVLVTDGGVEIPTANYVIVAKRVNLRVDTGYANPQIAAGLDQSKTYRVRLTVASTNPAGGRCYDAGLYGYITDPTAIGAMGPIGTQSLGAPAVMTTRALYPGTVLRYSMQQCTRIQLRYVTNQQAGHLIARVRDLSGVQVGEDVTIDAFHASMAIDSKAIVADGLPHGDYILEVVTGNTKHASATSYRAFLVGGIAVDTTQAGDPATGDFDDRGASPTVTVAAPISIQATGNVEYAIMARRPSDPSGTREDFISGTHGHETAPTGLQFKVSGSTIDYAAAAAGAVWNGQSVEWSYETRGKFPGLSEEECAVFGFSQRVDRTGYWYDTTRTMLLDAMVKNEYAIMIQAPKPGGLEAGLGGGMRDVYFWPSTDHMRAVLDNETAFLSKLPATKIAVANDACFSVAELLNDGEVSQAMAGIGGPLQSQMQDRRDGFTKAYTRTATFAGAGTLIPAGHSVTMRRRMRFGLIVGLV